MNLFKKLDVEYRKSCIELSQVPIDTHEYYVVKKRQESLRWVLELLKNMSWVKREEVKKKLVFFMENNYDYSKLSTEFNMSKSSAYVLISRASKEFEKVVGWNIVDEILQDRFAIENVAISTNNINQILIDEIKGLIKPRETKGINLLECMQEAVVLKNLTKPYILTKFSKLDLEKLEHILYIADSNDAKYSYERELVKGYLKGEIKNKEELQMRLK